MPNWCYNCIEIHGPANSRDRFDRFLESESRNRSSNLDGVFASFSPLCAFIPMPDYYKANVGFNDGGYEWCLENWGTKWSENDFEIERTVDYHFLSFDTAWSPPNQGYEKISSFFDDLTFCHIWSEGGMGFAGYAVYRNGDTISTTDVDIPEVNWDEDDSGDAYSKVLSDIHIHLMKLAHRFIPVAAEVDK